MAEKSAEKSVKKSADDKKRSERKCGMQKRGSRGEKAARQGPHRAGSAWLAGFRLP